MFNKFADDYFVRFADTRSNYNIPKIEQINLEGQRLYLTPSGTKYPSMSTVTKLLSEEAIKAWRKRVGPEEAQRVSNHASRRGTGVHKLAEHYILGENLDFKTTFRKCMPDAQLNWKGVKKCLDERLTEVRASECQLFSHMLRLAGTTDCIGIFDGKLSVIDFKTSAKIKKEDWIQGYFLQCNGYGQMWHELTGELPEQIVIIIACDALPNEPQVFVKPFGEHLPALKKLRLEYFKREGV